MGIGKSKILFFNAQKRGRIELKWRTLHWTGRRQIGSCFVRASGNGRKHISIREWQEKIITTFSYPM